MNEHTLADIRALIAQHAKLTNGVDGIADGDDLFAAGMTSLNSVNLMLALEDHFEIEFPDAMLTRGTFESIEAIAAAIAGLAPSA